jgi:hypothetical protein
MNGTTETVKTGYQCPNCGNVLPYLAALAPGQKKGSGAFCAQHPLGRSGKRLLTPFSEKESIDVDYE